MSFVTVLLSVLAGFVLLAPVAMAALLVSGGVPLRRSSSPAGTVADVVEEAGVEPAPALSRAA